MLDLNKDNFEAEVLNAPAKVFVMFSGDGCAPCAAIKPFVMQCGEKYADKLKFGHLLTNQNRRLAIGQKVMGIPFMGIYENGQRIDQLTKDEITGESVEALIQKHLG